MHRADFKKRKKLYLRIFSYSILTILTLVTTVALLYLALGYRVDRKGAVIRSGLLIVNSNPVSADIYINSVNKNDPTDSRFVLPEGSYKVELKRDGYRPWAKAVGLKSSEVENIYYPVLIPNKLDAKKQLNVSQPDVVSQSPDRKLAFVYAAGGNPQLLELDSKLSKLTNLQFPANMLASDGSMGSLKMIEWSKDSKHVLVQQSIPGVERLLSLNVNKPSESIDVTTKFGGVLIQKPGYGDNSGSQILGVTASSLVRYNLDETKQKVLIKKIKSFAPFDEESIAFVRLSSDDTKLEAGVLKKDSITVVRSKLISSKNQTGVSLYSRYDGNYYLTTQLGNETAITIYSNPLSRPVLNNQLAFAKVPTATNSKLELSDNHQFVMATNHQKITVFDFDKATHYRFTPPKSTTSTTWLDSHHLLYKTNDSKTSVSEFDGANVYDLVDVDFGQLMFSPDQTTSYRITKAGESAQLQSIDMAPQTD